MVIYLMLSVEIVGWKRVCSKRMVEELLRGCDGVNFLL